MGEVIGVGLIGAGWIGRVHAEQYTRVRQICPLSGLDVRLRAVADVAPKLLASAAADFGFERAYADWRDLISDPEVHLVDICVPNSLHREIAVAAAQAGKHIFCEKPMSTSADEGQAMFGAAEAAGVLHMVNFNYRRAPAIAFAKQLLDDGVVGKPYHFRGGFSQDFAADPQIPWSWRFDKDQAGAGSVVTMGSHVIDCARYLMGDVSELVASLDTFISQRPKVDGGVGQVNVDDSSTVLVRFHSGQVGMLYTTWLAHGRKHHFEWELNASRGSICFNSERLNELSVSEASDPEDRQGFRTIYVGEHQPYGDILGLKAGMGIGIRETFLLQIYELLQGLSNKISINPSFYDGWQVDRTVEAIKQSSAERRWVQL